MADHRILLLLCEHGLQHWYGPLVLHLPEAVRELVLEQRTLIRETYKLKSILRINRSPSVHAHLLR